MKPINKPIRISFLLAACMAGCAPKAFDEGLPWLIQQYHTVDAKTQTVEGMPFLCVNAFLLDRLDNCAVADDPASARTELADVLEACRQLADATVANEIDRLPPEAFAEIWALYFPDEPIPPQPRKILKERYAEILEPAWLDYRASIEQTEIDAIVGSIRKRVRPSIKDKHGHGAFLAMMMASIRENRSPLDRGGDDVDIYEIDTKAIGQFRVGITPTKEDALLAKYAPIIVQERNADADYGPEADMIGTVRLSGTYDAIEVTVDTGSPSVYAYWQRASIHDKEYIQLIYCHWFPKRPALKFNDPEAGRIDGATLRITLDANDQPAVFETILNCGCYHRCYVSDTLEEAARRAFGPPVEGQTLSIAQHVPGKPAWIIPETVAVPVPDNVRPILFSRAGYHGLAGVSFDMGELEGRTVRQRRSYKLTPYGTLEHLETPYGFGSMFGDDGLVHLAGRREGWLLAGTGMVSAGQPRQRGTRRIYWDQYDFDNPRLLDDCLRLPESFGMTASEIGITKQGRDREGTGETNNAEVGMQNAERTTSYGSGSP